MTAPFEQMMRWSYRLAAAAASACSAAAREVDSRVADIVWYALLARCWRFMPPGASIDFVACQSQLARCWRRAFGLGFITMMRVMVLIALASVIWTPDRHLCGPAAQARPPSCSRWRNSWPPFPANLLFPLVVSLIVVWNAQSRHLAVAADGAGHAMVHPVQRDRRRQPPCRSELRDAAENFGVSGWLWWRKVALPARVSLLRHRRDHRLGRLLERRDRGRSGELGQRPRCMPMAWAPISPTPRRRAISTASCWASR